MPPWCPLTPYKGLFILVLAFVLLEYILNTNSTFDNSNKLPKEEKESPGYGPLLKTLLFKNNKTYDHNSSLIYTTKNESYYNYVVTEPPFLSTNLNLNISSSTPAVIEVSTVIEAGNDTKINSTALPLCPDDISSNLVGRIPIIRTPVPTLLGLEKRFNWLKPGGHWQPTNCKVLKSVAIVIPYRCRGEHLLLFLQHMHPFLKKQMLDYTIFVVEQEGDGPFNRAALMNIGFDEALKTRKFDCFIFHDIDLLPEDDRNLYTCPEQPRHMSVAVDIFKYKLPYPAIFGGVSAISTDHFKLLNGFSNSFWGWGGEDDDMSNRIRYHHLHISRYPVTIARYTMLTHKKDIPSSARYEILKQGQQKYDKDGLNSLKFKLIRKKLTPLYTWVFVNIEPLS